jgi:glycosyltransferase involved in cell wall biosynthesis
VRHRLPSVTVRSKIPYTGGTVTVTVIIPTYRRSRYLDYSLASFTHQRDSDFEIVVVNDGGDEDARHTVEKYRRDLHVT